MNKFILAKHLQHITIPKELRRQLGICQSGRIEFSLLGDHVETRARSSSPGETGSGFVKLKGRCAAMPTDFDPATPEAMIGFDTNVRARHYNDDDADTEAQWQRSAAHHLFELEWVTRGYYGLAQLQMTSVMQHLLEQRDITVKDRESVKQSMSNSGAGIDFGDALHPASYRSCASFASFDDRKFALHANLFAPQRCGRTLLRK